MKNSYVERLNMMIGNPMPDMKEKKKKPVKKSKKKSKAKKGVRYD